MPTGQRAGDGGRCADKFKFPSMKNNLSFTRKCIRNLSDNFRANPDLYFNESDLQSCLFAMLLKRFNGENEIKNINVWGTDKKRTVKTVSTRKLHSELLLPEGRIDLAVLELESIRFAVNSKGRNPGFQVEEGNHIFIEIKASRTNRSNIFSKNRWYSLIASDIEKLNKYTNQCFMVCFDFNLLLGDLEVSSLREKAHKNIEIFYVQTDKSTNYIL